MSVIGLDRWIGFCDLFLIYSLLTCGTIFLLNRSNSSVIFRTLLDISLNGGLGKGLNAILHEVFLHFHAHILKEFVVFHSIHGWEQHKRVSLTLWDNLNEHLDMIFGQNHFHRVHYKSDFLLHRVFFGQRSMLTDLGLELVFSNERNEVIGKVCEFVLHRRLLIAFRILTSLIFSNSR